LKERGITNARIDKANMYDFYAGSFDGVLSIHTLSWLPNPYKALEKMCSLGVKWIAASSLFYDGPVSCQIMVEEPERDQYYNVYSLPLIERFLYSLGYTNFQYTPFEIDQDLPRPRHKGMGTYTEKTIDNRRLQVSGPLLMPWYFIAARKGEVNGTKE
jgi:hypothetical protein